MVLDILISKTIFTAWSNALGQFEDYFIAICDYRPVGNNEMEIKRIFQEACINLFNLMEDEIGSIEEGDISLIACKLSDEIQLKLINYTDNLNRLNSKIKAFLAERTPAQKQNSFHTFSHIHNLN